MAKGQPRYSAIKYGDVKIAQDVCIYDLQNYFVTKEFYFKFIIIFLLLFVS